MNESTYSIPKPKLPAWTIASVVIVLGGVIALGVIAFLTFRLFNLPTLPAALLAGVIEYSTFTAGVNLIRGNRLTIPEIVIGLIGSSVVNYIHFQAANNSAVTKVESPVLLATLAVFPLFAIFASSLWIGKEIKEHGGKVAGWEAGRNAWTVDQAAKADAARVDAQKREQEARERKQEADRLATLEAERIRAASAEKIRLAEIASQERKDKRADKIAAQMAQSESVKVVTVAQPGTDGNDTAQPGTYDQFRLAQMARNGSGPMDHKRVMAQFNVSKRTAYRWLAQYEEEQALPVHVEVN